MSINLCPLISSSAKLMESEKLLLMNNKKCAENFKKYENEYNNTENKKSEKKINCAKKYQCFLGEFETELYWKNIIGIAMGHIIAVYGFYHVLCSKNVVFSLFYMLIIGGIVGFGVTAGVHRYYTHRSFKANIPLKLILLLAYSFSGQNTVLEWVRDHRIHHKYSETDADPHDSRRGFFFSHIGWLMMKKKFAVIEKGKTLDLSDIYEDKLVQFHTKYFVWFKLIFCFIIPILIPIHLVHSTLMCSIWMNLVRYIITLHTTWCINSVAHMWGMRPFNQNIKPADNNFASFVSMGEGYHNYHHSFPWDYRAAEMGSPINITTFCLNFFAKIGWAYDLKTTSCELIQSYIQTKGEGSRNNVKD